MREIKFRAWDGKSMDDASLVWHSMETLNDVFENYKTSNEFHLMQYTGLKDKNGKEIYEGDIVSYQLTYRDGTSGSVTLAVVDDLWEMRIIKDQTKWPIRLGCLECSLFSLSDSEIIGNIYEHPNLIPTT